MLAAALVEPLAQGQGVEFGTYLADVGEEDRLVEGRVEQAGAQQRLQMQPH